MTRWLVSFGVLTVVLGTLFLLTYASHRESLLVARREASLCLQESVSLRSQVIDLERALARAQVSGESQGGEQELEILLAEQDEVAVLLDERTAAGQVTIEVERGDLVVVLVAELLFPADGAALSESGAELLRRTGEVLQRYQPQLVVARGYTNDIDGRLAEGYPSGWELSAARSVAVIRLLQEQVGLDPARLAAAAYAGHGPGEDGPAAEGRRLGSRIELVLTPLPEPGESGQHDHETSEQPVAS